MKHAACLISLACLLHLSARADEEDYKRLIAANEILMDKQTALQKRIESLAEKVSILEERLARATNSTVSREQLSKIFDRLREEIEQKRKEDKQLILKSMEDLRKLVGRAPAAASVPTAERKERDVPEKEGYEYKIQENDTVSAIVAAYNEKFRSEGKKTITVKQVLEANPRLDPINLRVGKTILIPKPSEK